VDNWKITLNDVVTAGRVRAEDIILSGPRGIGKTVAMRAMAQAASDQGFETVDLQAVSDHAGLVDSLMQKASILTTQESGPWKRALAAFERLGGLTLGFAGVSAGVTTKTPPPAQAIDPGILADTLATLATEVARDHPRGGLLITVDELQVASAADLALLAATLHRLNVDHPLATVLFLGTGLAHITSALSKAGVTHPDRLFHLMPLPLTLSDDDARYALVEPARRAGVVWEPAAVQVVLDASQGYPAHLQFYAHQTWRLAPGPDRITEPDARSAVPIAERELSVRTLQPRWSRMTDRQMEFMAALALLGGETSISALARTLGRSVSDLSWLRDALLNEGDIYSTRRGRVAYTVPNFARYVLKEYDSARLDSAIELMPLATLRQNAESA